MKGCYIRDSLLYLLTNAGIKVLNTNTLEIIKEYPFKFKLSLTNKIFYHNGKIYVPTSDELGKIYVWNDELLTSNQSNISDEPEIQVYPNPADGYVTIENTDNETMHCSLLNMAGYEILTRKGTSKLTIETTEVPDGLYIVKLETAKGIRYSKILIIH